MHFKYRFWNKIQHYLVALVLVLFVLVGGIARNANAQVRITYAETQLITGQFQYDYTLYNDYDALAFVGYNLYDISFDQNAGTPATVTGLPVNWDQITTDDFIEAFALIPDVSDIAPGNSLKGLQLTSDSSLSSLTFIASVSDPNNPGDPITIRGISQSVAVSEPSSLSLVLVLLLIAIILHKEVCIRLYKGCCICLARIEIATS